MHSFKSPVFLITLTLLIVTLSGCATTETDDLQGRGGSTGPVIAGPVYRPQLKPEMASPAAARQNLSELLAGTISVVPGIKLPSMPPSCDAVSTAQLQAFGQGAPSKAAVYCDASGRTMYLLFNNLRVLKDRISASDTVFVRFADLFRSDIVVERLSPDAAEVAISREGPGSRPFNLDGSPHPYRVIYFYFVELDEATAFADDLFVLQQAEKKASEKRQSLFAAKLAQYRAGVKPAVTEEQRRFIVQANAMTQRKDYARAVDLYLKALDVDPVAYPSAYFNLALLSARMQRYKTAIGYMKQYLSLVPDAKDARSAQDKIYEWEALLDK